MEKILVTDRLFIEKLSEDDFDKLYRVHSDPEVMLYIGNGQPRGEEQVKLLYEKMLRHQENHGFSLCPTYEKESGDFIGFAGLVHLALDDSSPDIEVGYWLLPEFWGKGYATEATKACIQWAFDDLSIDRVVGVTHPDHSRSQHVLKKSGLHFVGKSKYGEKEVKRFEIERST